MTEKSLQDFKKIFYEFDKVQAGSGKLDNYNLLDVVGVKKKEVIFSRILAWLFDEKAGHNCKNEFLVAFLAKFNIGIDEDGSFVTDYTVLTEHKEKNSIIDICIYKPRDFLIYIENKTISEERDDQLKDEFADMESLRKRLGFYDNKKCYNIFLTPDGRRPISDKHNTWHTLNFLDLADAIDSVSLNQTSEKTRIFVKDINKWFRRMGGLEVNSFTELDKYIICNYERINNVVKSKEELQNKLIRLLKSRIEELPIHDDKWHVVQKGKSQVYIGHEDWKIKNESVIWIGIERYWIARLFNNGSLSAPNFYVWVMDNRVELAKQLRYMLDQEKKIVGEMEKTGTENSYVVKHELQKMFTDELYDIMNIIESPIKDFFEFYMGFKDKFTEILNLYKEKNQL